MDSPQITVYIFPKRPHPVKRITVNTSKKNLTSNSFELYSIRKPGNYPKFWATKTLWVKKQFSEQLSEFQGILGAILGIAVTT